MEQLRTIDKMRLRGYVGKLDEDALIKLDEVILISTGVQKIKV